jgi:hypothetical protein
MSLLKLNHSLIIVILKLNCSLIIIYIDAEILRKILLMKPCSLSDHNIFEIYKKIYISQRQWQNQKGETGKTRV